MLSNVSRYVVWIIAVLYILSVFGVNTAAIITGLGVASLVIGLAFQDILKDMLRSFDKRTTIDEIQKKPFDFKHSKIKRLAFPYLCLSIIFSFS